MVYACDVATNASRIPATRTIQPLIRWAAFTGIILLVVRRFVYLAFPNLLPSRAWQPEWWRVGLLIDGIIELFLIILLLGVPVCIYFFRLRTGQTSVRDMLIDCASGVGLYLAALLLM
jgi:hypothetical protein